MNLPHALERSVRIRATRATVFSFFTDPARFAAWWGEGSHIDPRPGGAVRIRYPNGVLVRGEVLAIEPPVRIVFTYGYESGTPIEPGASRVAVTLAAEERGTRVDVRHEFAEPGVRDQHDEGWRYQLSVFANVASAVQHAAAQDAADAFLAVWTERDAAERRRRLAELCAATVSFHDQHAAVAGSDELAAHIGACHRFLPAVRLERQGAVRQCQGTALVEWRMLDPEGRPQGTGTNVFEFAADGRIERVVGLPAAQAGG